MPKKKIHNISLITSVGFVIEDMLQIEAFNMFMSNLLREHAADIYRSKGVLCFEKQPEARFVFQGVHEQINFGPAEREWGADELKHSKMVFIGKTLNIDAIEKGLRESTGKGDAAKIKVFKKSQ